VLTERWVPIFQWEGIYEVSDRGRVRSVRTGNCLKPALVVGYHFVSLQYRIGKPGERRRSTMIHRVMLESFTKARPSRHVYALHRDGNRTNNVLANLYWGDAKQNMADKERHGRAMHGENHHRVKLREKDVLKIIDRLAKGERPMRIAESYPQVTPTAIYDIKNLKSWMHIARPEEKYE
jgi:hypothetical protein